jgi:hypothetical protein
LHFFAGGGYIHQKGAIDMAVTRLLKTSLVRELTILAAAVVALTGAPETVLADQSLCDSMCGSAYEQYVAMCEQYFKGDPTGYEYCLNAADEQFTICEEDCFV